MSSLSGGWLDGMGCNVMQVGRTERLDNQKDAAFSTTFTLDYLFEEVQQVQYCTVQTVPSIV